VYALLSLPGRTALLLVDDLVVKPSLLLEERREMDAMDSDGIVVHVSAIDLMIIRFSMMKKGNCSAIL
jgi:hypothetical protein